MDEKGKATDAAEPKLLFAYEPKASYRPRFRLAETAAFAFDTPIP